MWDTYCISFLKCFVDASQYHKHFSPFTFQFLFWFLDFHLSECAIWFSRGVPLVYWVSLLSSSRVLLLTIGYLVLLIISVHAVKVRHCFICFTWPDLPKFGEFWVPLFSAAAKSGGPRGLDLADFLKGTGQRVQVPRVLVLDFPQTQNHWWWALLTCKVAQVPTGRGKQSITLE